MPRLGEKVVRRVAHGDNVLGKVACVHQDLVVLGLLVQLVAGQRELDVQLVFTAELVTCHACSFQLTAGRGRTQTRRGA